MIDKEKISELKEFLAHKRKADSIGIVELFGLLDDWLKTQTFVQPKQLKPSWDNAPSWANWLAQDCYGKWTWFEERPVKVSSAWISDDKNKMYVKATIENWQQTLEQRPRPKVEVEVGQVWKYTQNGDKYQIDSIEELKKGDGLGWTDCVTYRSLESGKFYARELIDFLAKFERVS